jgi:hypothetical protein
MTTNTANTANTASANKKRVTAQDVAMLMLVGGGVEAVTRLHESAGIVAGTFDKAVELLAASPENADALADLRDSLFASEGTGARGRPAVAIGQTRTYRVQEVGDTGAFIRLPVGLLGLEKGQTATVSFENGKITVR